MVCVVMRFLCVLPYRPLTVIERFSYGRWATSGARRNPASDKGQWFDQNMVQSFWACSARYGILARVGVVRSQSSCIETGTERARGAA